MKTINNYVEIIKQQRNKENIDYITGAIELESNEEPEIFRIIELDHNTKEAHVIDYEYSMEEDVILEWTAKADYITLDTYHKKNTKDLQQVILAAEDYLLEDFLCNELYDIF